MKKLPIVALSLLSVVTLAACGGRHYNERVATATIVSPAHTYPGSVAVISSPGMYVETAAVLRPGFGRVEATTPVMFTNGTPAGMQRLTLRMDDGSLQVLDSRGPNVGVGERVEITPERYIRYPIASR